MLTSSVLKGRTDPLPLPLYIYRRSYRKTTSKLKRGKKFYGYSMAEKKTEKHGKYATKQNLVSKKKLKKIKMHKSFRKIHAKRLLGIASMAEKINFWCLRNKDSRE